MKRAKRLYALIGVLAVVCVLTAAVLRYQEKQEEIQTSGQAVLEVDPDLVQSLSWDYEGEEFAFHKDEKWLYDGDESFPVDQDKLGELLEPFQSLGASFIIENVTDYGQYGLDDPVCTIQFSTGEESYTVTLGDYSTMDSQRYLSIGDGNVYLAAQDPLDVYSVTLKDLIQNDETPAFGPISAMEVQGEEPYQLVYQAYTQDSPYTYCSDDVYFKEEGEDLLPLDTARVEDYLDAITGLSLEDYVTYHGNEEDLSQYGLDDPELTVTVQYTPAEEEDASPQTFTLSLSRDPEQRQAEEDQEDGQDEEDLIAYARVGDSQIIYQISADRYQALMACGYDDLRHQEVFAGNLEDVTGLDISLEGETYHITSTGTGEDKTFSYGEEELDWEDLSSALEDLRADRFTQESPTQKEEISLTLYLDNEAHPQVEIALYRYDGEFCLSVLDGEPCSLVPRSAVVDLIEAVNAIVL